MRVEMAEKGEKRDPVTHRTPSQMKRAQRGQTEQDQEDRRARMRARYAMEKKGLVKENDGKDVAHKKPLSKGGSNAPSNLTVQSEKKNRGWEREKPGPYKPGRKR
jgi:hypothetical protein